MDFTTVMALLTGHLLGDFVLQSDGLAKRKATRTDWLILHAVVVAVITWILLGTLRAWPAAALLFVLHLGIDGLKRHFENGRENAGGESGNPWSFAFDQGLHVVSLVLLAWLLPLLESSAPLQNQWAVFWGEGYDEVLLLLSGSIATIWVLGFVLKFEMAAFAAELSPDVMSGLPRAGRTIGRIERLLVFIFVLAGHPAAVGFVVAAKSVFRIGELSNTREKNHAEYIMIGTLKSFAYALLLAFATRWLIARVGG